MKTLTVMMTIPLVAFCISGFAGEETPEPEQKVVCIELPCPDDCGIEPIGEQTPEVICFPAPQDEEK